MSPILEVRNLTRVFGPAAVAVYALRGIDLQVHRGELLAIVGASGSGKSTLLHVLAGVETPTSGAVLLEGKNLAEMNDNERTLMRRRRIGLIFQAFHLLPGLSALENVALPLLLDGVPRARARERARLVLERVCLSARLDHLPSTLSGGEQQRVAIARALVIEPAVLLADEPTGNLDSVAAGKIADLLAELTQSTPQQTVVLVTHDPQLAERATRTVRLQDGKVVSQESGVRSQESGKTVLLTPDP